MWLEPQYDYFHGQLSLNPNSSPSTILCFASTLYGNTSSPDSNFIYYDYLIYLCIHPAYLDLSNAGGVDSKLIDILQPFDYNVPCQKSKPRMFVEILITRTLYFVKYRKNHNVIYCNQSRTWIYAFAAGIICLFFTNEHYYAIGTTFKAAEPLKP